MLAGHAQGVLTVGSGQDPIALSAQDPLGEVPKGRVVFHDHEGLRAFLLGQTRGRIAGGGRIRLMGFRKINLKLGSFTGSG